jgi:hypothetical protein
MIIPFIKGKIFQLKMSKIRDMDAISEMTFCTSQDGDDRLALGFLPPNVAEHGMWWPSDGCRGIAHPYGGLS